MKRHKLLAMAANSAASWGGIGAIWVTALLSLAIYEAEVGKSLHASHDRLKWSFGVLANDRASADMKAAEEAARAQDDKFVDDQIDLWLDRELHRYRI